MTNRSEDEKAVLPLDSPSKVDRRWPQAVDYGGILKYFGHDFDGKPTNKGVDCVFRALKITFKIPSFALAALAVRGTFREFCSDPRTLVFARGTPAGHSKWNCRGG